MHKINLPLLKNITDWRQILRQNFVHLQPLMDYLALSQEQRSFLLSKPTFPIQVPLRLARKMKKGSLEDPIARQFLPFCNEEVQLDGFISDPVCDVSFQKEGKLLQKYKGRVLLITTGACAMHCRYCFRQNFEYGGNKIFQEEVDWIKKDLSIHEVILSGGDPLSLSDQILDSLLSRLSEIPHIKRIRFHTRFPIGIPERINDSFLRILLKIPQELYFVIHTNHAIELDEEVIFHLKLLKKIGCTLLHQSVLLKGVNDDEKTLKELCEKLIDSGILPYYIHQLDRVAGAAHFEVTQDEGRALLAGIAKELPGYAIPRYAIEIPGEEHKRVIAI